MLNREHLPPEILGKTDTVNYCTGVCRKEERKRTGRKKVKRLCPHGKFSAGAHEYT